MNEDWKKILDLDAQALKVGDATSKDKADIQKLKVFSKRADLLIEQIQHLYQQFLAGVADRPPGEARATLEQIMTQLQYLPKKTPAQKFHYNSLQARYVTYRERWDRMMRDLEQGRIARRKTSGSV